MKIVQLFIIIGDFIGLHTITMTNLFNKIMSVISFIYLPNSFVNFQIEWSFIW